VSPAVRRRRGLLLLALSLACGAIAASLVHDRVKSIERRVGPLVAVPVAARDLPAGERLRARDVGVRRIPAAFAPPDPLSPEAVAAEGRTAGAVAAGTYLTGAVLAGGRTRALPTMRPGQRAVEVAVASGPALSAASPGTRVDVVVSTEPRDGPGRTFVAIENAELLELRSLRGDGDLGSEPSGGARDSADALATLRVGSRQAVYLTAAQNFAREVRLLVRAPGDRHRIGRAAVAAGGL
jgi:pilus assembly protein CpaB